MDDAGAPRAVFVCASANPHKVAEMEELLADVVDLWPRPAGLPDVIEDADTLEANARLKAAAVAAATQRGAVADDTALEVDALDGAPGVRSHRFAGEHATDADNRALLLARLAGVPDAERTARFRTVVMVCLPDGGEIVTEGVCEGTIAGAERGDGGFGYDLLFVPTDGDGRTFAEMTADEKHVISHRGRAMRALAVALANWR